MVRSEQRWDLVPGEMPGLEGVAWYLGTSADDEDVVVDQKGEAAGVLAVHCLGCGIHRDCLRRQVVVGRAPQGWLDVQNRQRHAARLQRSHAA